MNMDPSLTLQIVSIIVGTIIVGPILWFVGKALVGPEKAKFTDALWIMLLGQVIGGLVGYGFGTLSQFTGFTASLIGFIIQLLVWLGLIRHFFDTGWGKAFIIAIIAVIVAAIVFFVLGVILAILLIIPAIL